jgi:protein TonB
MQAAQSQRYDFGGGRERAGALGLTLTVYALVLAFILFFGKGQFVQIKAEDALDTILIAPPKPPSPPPPSQPPAHREGGSPSLHKLSPEPALVPDTVAPAVIAPIVDLPKTEYALEGPASSASGTASAGGAGSGTGSNSGSGGAVIYRAQWQKLNTAEELHRKVPRSAPARGVGEIVCRAAKGFKVTDCKIWGETPKGSGFGQAVLGIAHLFRVKPPLVDGEPQIGAWVLVSISYNDFKPPLYGESR